MIGVRTNGGAAGFTLLSPPQPLAAAPYAITAANFTGTLSAGQLAGSYSGAVTPFGNPGNQFTGAFAGNGGGLTNPVLASLLGLRPIEAFGA